MTRTEFIAQLAAIVEQPDLAPDAPLADTGLWDSMAWVQVMGLCDACGMAVTGQQIGECATASQVLALAGLA
jgi:hypothetical protein